MVERPLPHRVAAALDHGDVERVDLRLEDHLGAARRRAPRRTPGPPATGGATSRASRCSVQSPPRSTAVGTAGSGTIEPDLLARAGELERRDVALDAGVVRGQRRGADELDRPVLAHQPAARACRCRGRRHRQRDHGGRHRRPRPTRSCVRTVIGPPPSAGRPTRPDRTLGRRAPPARSVPADLRAITCAR